MNNFAKGNNLLLSSPKTSEGPESILWLTPTDSSIITRPSTSYVSQWLDISGNDYHVSQAVEADQPLYSTSPSRRVVFGASDKLTVTLSTPINGIMVLGTTGGTARYTVSIPAGTFVVGRHLNQYMPDDSIFAQIIVDSSASEDHVNNLISYVRNILGAGNDYGSRTSFSSYWRAWTEITEFPTINTSNATSLLSTWHTCTGLTSFPVLDTTKVTNFTNSWTSCSNLTSFPNIVTTAGTNFNSTWANCSSLSSFPLLDFSNATILSAAWSNCSGLTSFPLINTTKVTTLTNTWANCSSLTSFPQIDTSSVTDFNRTWIGCLNLTSFPLLDTSSGTIFSDTWGNNRQLTSFPLLNVINGTTFRGAWSGCLKLVNFPANFFNGCSATAFNGSFANTNLSTQSIDNILVSINSNGTSNGTFNQSGGSAPSATGQAAITSMRSRGWSITVTGGF